MKKIMSFILALCLLFGSLGPSVAVAKESNESTTIKQLEAELQFYFEEAGGFDEEGNYYIKNVGALIEKANQGDENAKRLLEIRFSRENRGAKDFAVCIAKDYFGVYLDLINGNF